MNFIYGIITGLLIYSFIGILINVINPKQSLAFEEIWAAGIIGWILMLIAWFYRKINRWKKYHNKRSIILVIETGEKRWCNLKDTAQTSASLIKDVEKLFSEKRL